MMIVKDWELYDAGKKFNNSIVCVNNANYYDLMDTLVDFYNGIQWRNLEVTGMRKPVFNIMKKAVRFWVTSITANNTKIDIEPLEYSQNGNDPQMNVAEFASTEIANILEKFKIDNRIRDALFKAGIMGDCAAHFWFDPNKKPYGGAFGDVRGEICMELVNGTNVFFGNGNNPDVQSQPYIIISGRDTAKNLKAEAKKYRQNDSDVETITEDRATYQAGYDGEIEVDADGYGKATYIIVYKKVTQTRETTGPDGTITEEEYTTVTVSKCVQDAYIYQDVDTGLETYPISWLTWDKQENQYHGLPPCAEILETQIFINLMFAMVMLHLMMTAFPKAVYNADYIDSWTNQVGQAIPFHSSGDVDISRIATYLNPGQMSNQIVQVIDTAYNYVKDALGLSDAALGDINPEQASGTAILATAKQATIPLENTRANLFEFVEDFGRILLDMMGTYYGSRPIVVDQDGQKTLQTFDFTQLKNMWLNVKVDVGTTNVWSDTARKQTLTNLMSAGKITFIDWLERMDDTDIPDRQGLIDSIKATMQDKEFMYAQMAKFVDSLSPKKQAQLEQLRQKNPQEYEQTVKNMMQGGLNELPGVQQPASGVAQQA